MAQGHVCRLYLSQDHLVIGAYIALKEAVERGTRVVAVFANEATEALLDLLEEDREHVTFVPNSQYVDEFGALFPYSLTDGARDALAEGYSGFMLIGDVNYIAEYKGPQIPRLFEPQVEQLMASCTEPIAVICMYSASDSELLDTGLCNHEHFNCTPYAS